MPTTATIKLQSADDLVFNVDVDVAKRSNVLKTMIEDLGLSNGETIPVPQVKGDMLQKVIEWCTYHKYDLDEPDDSNSELNEDAEFCHVMSFDISGWDQEFLEMDVNKTLELVMAANYLDIKGLQKLACMNVAKAVMGKSPEEIRKTFGIENDLDECENEC